MGLLIDQFVNNPNFSYAFNNNNNNNNKIITNNNAPNYTYNNNINNNNNNNNNNNIGYDNGIKMYGLHKLR